jgi:outer membrane receptor protein involved in Fe transport
MMIPVRVLIGIVVTSLLLVPSALLAQGTGDIVGRVTDTSGGVLPGVSVTAENIGTKNIRTTVTSETGDYLFTLLPIGTYTVRIELQGFQAVTSKAVLTTGTRVRVDARLQVGSLSETLTVTGESPLLQTDTATLSTLVTEEAVQDLPVEGRNIIRLVQLVPGAHEGVNSSLADGTRPDERRQTSSVSINGIREVLNNQLIDGMDNNERAIGSIGIKPSLDATAEVRVQTNTYSAENGRTLGGVINIITKSGTNEFNGSAFEFYRGGRFDSRNYFQTEDPVLTQHQFGGSLGGPIRSNRTFFFGDYEVLRLDQGIANLITVPTAKMRTGDFSEIRNIIYDPLTNPRLPFPGNIIPQDRIDSIARDLVSLYPLPNQPGVINNYAATNVREQDHQLMDARVDHRFNDNNTMFARYSFNLVDTITPGFCPSATFEGTDLEPTCIGSPSPQGSFPGPNHTTAHNFTGSWVRVINPTLISEVKGAWSRPDILSTGFNKDLNGGDLFGIPNAFDGNYEQTGGIPVFNPSGYARMGDPNWVPLLTRDNNFHFAGSVTKTAGAHNIKIGGGVVLREFTVMQSNSAKGQWSFNTSVTRSDVGQGGGDAMAAFLLGYPNSVQRRYIPLVPFYHSNEPSFYIQDDWRANDWLTVNLGLRYDVYTPFTEEDNQLANFVPEERRILVAGVDGVSRTAGVNTDYSNIQPRFGFAASLPNRIVLRGGYGVSFYPQNKNANSFLKNPPFDATYGPVTSNAASNLPPNQFLKDGLPPATFADPSDPRGSVIGTGINYQSTRAQQFNLMVEKEFAGNVVTLGYVGHRGDRLHTEQNTNLAPAGPGNVDVRRPYYNEYPNMSSVTTMRNQGESKYNAMQLIFNRRLSGGLSANTHYTFAKSREVSLAPWDHSLLEWGYSELDTRHRYVLQLNYRIPGGESLTGVARGFLQGWQVNSALFWQTGIPFTVENSSARTNTGGNDRPNLIGDPELPSSQRTLDRWFNTDAFAAQPLFTAGNVGPSLLHGPNQRRWDLSFFKELPIGQNRLQIRYELYNVTNTASFLAPASNFGAGDFGTISSTGKAIPRQMQFGLKFLF